MERLGETKPKGLTAAALRTWGILLAAAGIIGRCVLQNTLLGIGDANAQQMLQILSSNPDSMSIAAVALVLQGLEACAIPIFALLLAEGFTHTKNYRSYLLRLAAVALVSELPYDLVMMGKLGDMGAQNPCLALVIGIVMLYLFRRFSQRSFGHILLRIFIVLAAIMWVEMLRIEHGTPTIVMVCVFWLMRNKPSLRGLVGAGAAMCCCIVSPFYLVASMGCLPVHMYRGEQGESNKLINYAAYPLLLLAVYLVGQFAF